MKFNDFAFHSTGNIAHNSSKDYFYRKKGLFHHLRPTYKHSSQKNLHLQYTSDGSWVIMITFRSISNDVIMIAKDRSIRPEYITSAWSFSNNTSYRLETNNNLAVKIRCKEIQSNKKCASNPCASGSTCLYNGQGEVVCVCLPGYYGNTCNITKKCPKPQTNDVTKAAKFLERIPGSLLVTFCDQGPPYFTFSVCKDTTNGSPTWSKQKECPLTKNQNITSPRSNENTDNQHLPNGFEIFAIVYGLVCLSVELFALLLIIVISCPVVKTTVEYLSQCCYWFALLWMIDIVLCTQIDLIQYKRILQNASVICLLFNVLGVVIESLFSEDFSNIRNLARNESVLNYISRLQHTPPVVMVTSECFPIASTHARHTGTFVNHVEFPFAVWTDVSERFYGDGLPLTRLRMRKLVGLGDNDTESYIQSFIEDIKLRSLPRRDENIRIRFKMHIPDFKENMLLYTNRYDQPYWARQWCFLLALILFLIWPYRWFVRKNTTTIEYTLKKLIYSRHRLNMQVRSH